MRPRAGTDIGISGKHKLKGYDAAQLTAAHGVDRPRQQRRRRYSLRRSSLLQSKRYLAVGGVATARGV